ncbi:MAG TPA: peroxidase-related enzyme [Silvibacterium sp.]|nr:peroxidase-related enzyme [Silvibacterium sp.]
MAHIRLPEGMTGIRAGFAFRPETAKPLNELVEVLLHDSHSLTPGERELIATYVSYLNDCYYCQTCHGFIAAAHLGDEDLVKRVKADFQHADISEKLKAFLVVASKVQKGGKHVTAEDVEHARSLGATDLEIHDTVLIAAAFCMYNRYVDGLGTWQPQDEALYRERGKHVARIGYVNASKKYLPAQKELELAAESK